MINLNDVLTELVIGALLSLIAAVGKVIRTKRAAVNRRTRLQQDLALYQELETSPAKEKLKKHIEQQVDVLVNEPAKRVDPAGIILGLFFLGGGAWLGWTALNLDAWWAKWPLILVAAVMLLFAAVGLLQDAIPRVRDESGRPLKDVKTPEK